MADDYSATINTTGKLTVGGSATGEFETSYDSDWLKVSLKANTTYLFTLSGSATGDGTLANFQYLGMSMMDSKGSYSYGTSYIYTGSAGRTFQFTASTSGDYFLNLNANADKGSYTVRAATPAGDDYSNNSSTTGRLQAGVATAAVFERADDIDWFKLHAEEGQIIVFDADGVAGGSQGNSQRLVYDSKGSLAAFVTNGPFKVSKAGDYYLAVNADGRIGAYSQSMQVVTDDYADDASSSGRLYAGAQANGSLDYYGDNDRFQMAVEAGQVYTLSLRVSGVSASNAIGLLVQDALNGGTEYANVAADGTLTLRYLATNSGSVNLNVSGSVANRPAYVLSASQGEADDFGGTRDSAGTLTPEAPLSGVLQSSRDTDMFKIELTAGVTYNIALDGATSTVSLSGRLNDSGSLDLNWSSYNGKPYSYTPSKTGTYYITAGNSYSSSTGITPYTLTVTTPEDDYSASVSGAGRLLVGGAIKGTLGEGGGDRDWFAVNLSANGYYWFRLEGSRENGGTLSSYPYAFMKLYDASGKEVAATSGSWDTTAGVLAFKAPQRGNYYLEVSAPGNSGSYTVKAQLGIPDDYGNDAAHAAPIQAGLPFKGTLELAGDKDVFKLSTVTGMTYVVELAPDAATNSWQYATTLSASDGSASYTPIRITQLGSKVYGVFDAVKGGDYYVTLASSTSYNTTGGYTMAVRAAGIDDYAASTGTTGFITPASPVQGALHVSDDQDWIKVHLDAGRTYVFDLQGRYSGGGTLDTSVAGLYLQNANGSTMASSTIPGSSAGSDPRIQYVASATGDYYLNVRTNYNANASSTGTYTVKEVQTNLDTSGPQLLSSSVASGASNVAPWTKIVLNFDETVMLGSGITLTDSLGTKVGSNYVVQATVAGSVITFDPHAPLTPGMQYTLNLQPGSVVDLAGNAASASQSLSFSVTAPVVAGTAGNDYLLGNGGQSLDGGAGLDTVFYTDSVFRYTYRRQADGSIEVRNYDNYEAVQKLTGVERLMFADRAYAADIDGLGGQAYRMYQSAFNRTPDSAGLGFWMDKMEKGMRLLEVADRFIGSAEFATRYGDAPTDTSFVTLLYKNVLHREPQAFETTYWLNALHSDQSRAQVLLSFSESAENQDNVVALIGNGFTYTPYAG